MQEEIFAFYKAWYEFVDEIKKAFICEIQNIIRECGYTQIFRYWFKKYKKPLSSQTLELLYSETAIHFWTKADGSGNVWLTHFQNTYSPSKDFEEELLFFRDFDKKARKRDFQISWGPYMANLCIVELTPKLRILPPSTKEIEKELAAYFDKIVKPLLQEKKDIIFQMISDTMIHAKSS